MIAADLDDRVYGHAADCAELLAESPWIANPHDRIRDWIRRGKLHPRGEFDGRPVYAMADVYRVEKATRRHGKRGQLLTRVLSIAQDAH